MSYERRTITFRNVIEDSLDRLFRFCPVQNGSAPLRRREKKPLNLQQPFPASHYRFQGRVGWVVQRIKDKLKDVIEERQLSLIQSVWAVLGPPLLRDELSAVMGILTLHEEGVDKVRMPQFCGGA